MSYATAAKDNVSTKNVNFRSFDTGLKVGDQGIDVVLSKESVRESSKHYDDDY